MNIEITEVAPCRKRMQVELDVPEVDEAFETAFAEVKQAAQVPGFRKGHVPRKLLERRFGKMIEEDVRAKLFQKGFLAALKQEDLSPLGEPDIKLDELTAERGTAFNFSTEVDVRPVFELAPYEGLELEEAVEPVTDAEVDERLEALQQNFADHVPIDEPAAENHLIEGHVVLRAGGEEIFNEEERALRLEGTKLFGIEVGDLMEKLGGVVVGDERTLNFTLPEEYPREDLRGKDAEMSIKVGKVLRTELPLLDDAFAARVGLPDLESLREQLRLSMTEERRRQAREQTEEQLVDKLIEANPFDIPAGLVARQAENNLKQAKLRLAYMGTGPDDVQAREEELKAESQEQAERMIRRMIILDAIAETQELRVDESDIQAHLMRLSQAYRTSPEQMLKEIQDRDGMAAMEHEIRDIKVVEFLIEAAKITNPAAPAEAAADATDEATPDAGDDA